MKKRIFALAAAAALIFSSCASVTAAEGTTAVKAAESSAAVSTAESSAETEFSSEEESAGRWKKLANGHWQYLEKDESGRYQPVTGWKQIDGNWYYFVKEDREYGNFEYHIEGEGIAPDTFKKYERVSGFWISSSPVGDEPNNDAIYYVQDDGTLKTGWVQRLTGHGDTKGDWFYMDPVTFRYRSGWYQESGKWYYFHPETRRMIRDNWLWENGKWYYADDDGHFYQNSWVRTYYTPFDEEAIIVGSEPVRTSGTIRWNRYFRSDCSMAVGWEKIGADWYYFKADGSVYDGWLSSGGKWYYLKDGVMQVNTTIDGYQIGSDGVWIR